MRLIDIRLLTNARRLPAAVACALAMAGLWAWLECRGAAMDRAANSAYVRQVQQMRADAVQIAALRAVPQKATDRQRPNDELLDQVRAALDAANMADNRWVGNDPSHPIRVPKTAYKRLSTRLSFRDISLEQLCRFCHALVAEDHTLQIERLNVANSRAPDSDWDAEIAVGYLIYSPHRLNNNSIR